MSLAFVVLLLLAALVSLAVGFIVVQDVVYGLQGHESFTGDWLHKRRIAKVSRRAIRIPGVRREG